VESLHHLLKRQLRRAAGNPDSFPNEWRGLIALISDAYYQFDDDRAMLERSLDLSSKELIQANSEMRAVFERVIASSVDGIFAFDRVLRCTVWNPGMERITGVHQEAAINQSLLDIFPQLGRTGDDRHLRESLLGKTTIAKESTYHIQTTGQQGFFESHFSPLRNETGEIVGGLAIIRNITERKLAEQVLEDLAVRDSLTNLYNRRYFNERMEKEIALARRHKSALAILLCDLDNFKTVNDTRSHPFGDEILKAVAKNIQTATRGIDLVFRWGGDEIVVILLANSRQGATQAAERIRESVIEVGRKADFDLDVSIGVALYPEHGDNVDQLIRLADQALYIAKKRGDKIHLGEEEYELDDQVVQVAFQPIIDIRRNEILGYEALSRDIQEKLSIDVLFKKYDAIGKLDRLKEICFEKQIKTAQSLGLGRVFINADFELLTRLDPLEKPSHMEVIVEISEKEALQDMQRHLKIAQAWRKKGFQFAIDDFGAGFISLPFIAKLIPDYIKIDRSAILQAVSSEKFRNFLNYLVLALKNYARKGMLAEGIETRRELGVVKKMEISLAQGFLLGKPAVVGSSDAKK
jgi:diguanylate cyclase (GGDEF)-like protein/PAS domain S-box-containing protein